eukprot:scaffold25636_cov57-Phaeocystis_antarctica.AAC.3
MRSYGNLCWMIPPAVLWFTYIKGVHGVGDAASEARGHQRRQNIASPKIDFIESPQIVLMCTSRSAHVAIIVAPSSSVAP